MGVSLQKTDLKVEVLVNSPGVHDEVRIRRPYAELQRRGVDCRIHERPFRMSQCIRRKSIVIWQRPLPDSRKRMIEHFDWLTQRESLLFVDLDDHIRLFDSTLRSKLKQQDYANLRFCHGIITSNAWLAQELSKYNRNIYTVDNNIGPLKKPDLKKHEDAIKVKGGTKIFIANQNRNSEHKSMIKELQRWLKEDEKVHLVIINDKDLARKLPEGRISFYPRVTYAQYRKILSRCHVALAPLFESIENRCKTVIKWQECTADGVVLVAGPELYGKTLNNQTGTWVSCVEELIKEARRLANDPQLRVNIVEKALKHYSRYGWDAKSQSEYHYWLLSQLWRKRDKLHLRALGNLEPIRELMLTQT